MLNEAKQAICPNCSAEYQIDAGWLGRKATCKRCSSRFVLNEATAGSTVKSHISSGTESTAGSVTDTSGAQQPRSTTSRAAARDASRHMGRFLLKRLLGRGGFGEVWEAEDTSLKRPVAIKLPLFGAHEKRKVERFLTEGRTIAQLRHPNIVALYDIGQAQGSYYLATEFVQGRPLNVVGAEQALKPDEAVWLIVALARALQYAHDKKIIHRDIKPHNIIVSDSGVPQLLDFGLAKIIDDDVQSKTVDGSVLGTPGYMPPEQARGDIKSIGPAADQYSLAASLYFLLTGRAPFEGPTAIVLGQVINQLPTAPKKIRPDISPSLEAIVLKALSKVPSERYRDCAALANDLERYLNGEETDALRWSLLCRAGLLVRRHPWNTGAAATAATLLLVFALWSVSGWSRAATLTDLAMKAEESSKQKLAELETLQGQMKAELQRLTDAKARSDVALQEELRAQQEALNLKTQLEKRLQENVKVRRDTDTQLAAYEKNTKLAKELSQSATQEGINAITNRASAIPLFSSEQMLEYYQEVVTALDKDDVANAGKMLNDVPENRRGLLWKLIRYRESQELSKRLQKVPMPQASTYRISWVDLGSNTAFIDLFPKHRGGKVQSPQLVVDLSGASPPRQTERGHLLASGLFLYGDVLYAPAPRFTKLRSVGKSDGVTAALPSGNVLVIENMSLASPQAAIPVLGVKPPTATIKQRETILSIADANTTRPIWKASTSTALADAARRGFPAMQCGMPFNLISQAGCIVLYFQSFARGTSDPADGDHSIFVVLDFDQNDTFTESYYVHTNNGKHLIEHSRDNNLVSKQESDQQRWTVNQVPILSRKQLGELLEAKVFPQFSVARGDTYNDSIAAVQFAASDHGVTANRILVLPLDRTGRLYDPHCTMDGKRLLFVQGDSLMIYKLD